MSDLQEMTQLVEEAAQAYPYREPRIDPILYQVDIPKMMPTAAVPENYVRRNPNEKPVWQPNIRASHVVDQYVSRMREMFVPVWPVTLPCERRARQERLTFDIENKFKLHRDHEKELLRQKEKEASNAPAPSAAVDPLDRLAGQNNLTTSKPYHCVQHSDFCEEAALDLLVEEAYDPCNAYASQVDISLRDRGREFVDRLVKGVQSAHGGKASKSKNKVEHSSESIRAAHNQTFNEVNISRLNEYALDILAAIAKLGVIVLYAFGRIHRCGKLHMKALTHMPHFNRTVNNITAHPHH